MQTQDNHFILKEHTCHWHIRQNYNLFSQWKQKRFKVVMLKLADFRKIRLMGRFCTKSFEFFKLLKKIKRRNYQ
ncbi:unnamed protein product [Lactuca virosa]|uniref:Uncharacterized protein n=1 Tax=Lactuca virosa TaxID=75947 RepID=A0AAU9NE18_9ASTR|nr:unnamed protein product [Lactuca virosa]